MTDVDQPVLAMSPGRRLMVSATVVLTGIVMNAATFTVTAILPQMQGALAATADEIAWTMTFNLLATAIALPLVGWIVPRFGRRLVLLVSMAMFTAATFACGISSSLEGMIFWRIVQGAAGAALMPLGQLILLDIYPRRLHSLVISIFGVANTFGPVLGPLVGGHLAEHYSWRLGFHMLVPLGLLSLASTWFAMPDDRAGARPSRLDWFGFGTLALATGLIQYVLSRGQRVDWFQSTEIVVATGIAVLALYLFVVHALTSPAPFIDLGLLRDRNYAIGNILIIAFGMLSFAPMVILPPLMQVQMGFPDGDVGIVIGWRGIGVTVGFLLCIVLSRLDDRLLIAAGFAAHLWSGLWMLRFDLSTPLFDFAANAFLQGTSVGLVWAPISTITFLTIRPEARPQAMALFHLVRSVATSFFIAVSVAEIVRTTGANYARLTEWVGLNNKALALPSVVGGWDPTSLAGLAALSREINRQAAMIGHLNTFVVYTVIAALAIPLVLLVSKKRTA